MSEAGQGDTGEAGRDGGGGEASRGEQSRPVLSAHPLQRAGAYALAFPGRA